MANKKKNRMDLPYSYDVRSPRAGEHCNNCEHYFNNYCDMYDKQVEPYAWCASWDYNEV